MKRVIALFLICVVLCSQIIPASAAVKEEIMPLYNHISSVYACLTIDESTGIATCTGDVVAKKAVPVKVIVSLQVYKDGYWQGVKSWSLSDTLAAHTTNYYAVYSGYEYRVYVTGYVYNSAGVIQESGYAIHTVNYPKN